MSKNNEKRFFTQFETTDEEKESLKKFVDDKNTTMSQFIRTCIRFFMYRNVTPEEFLMQEMDTKSISGVPDSFLQDLERRDLELKESLDNIHKEISDMKTSVTNEFIAYLSTTFEELTKAKGGT